MQVQVNTNRSVAGSDELYQEVRTQLARALDRFAERITRVEAHLSDQNSDKKGGADDMRCVLEARLSGLQPIAVSHDAETIPEAVSGAAEKLRRSVTRIIERSSNR